MFRFLRPRPFRSFSTTTPSPLQIGDLATLGLNNSTPPGLIRQTIEVISSTTQLPWWATITLFTLSTRVLLLPFFIKTQRNSIALYNIRDQSNPLQEKMKQCQAQGDTSGQHEATAKLQKLWKEHGISPLKMLLGPLTQVPVYLFSFVAISSLAKNVPQMQSSEFLWCSDLTASDPYLPIVSAIGFLAVLEKGSEGQPNYTPTMKYAMRGLTVASIYFTYQLPAAVFVYWLTSNLFSLFQLWLIQRPSIAKRLKVPIRKPYTKVDNLKFEDALRLVRQLK